MVMDKMQAVNAAMDHAEQRYRAENPGKTDAQVYDHMRWLCDGIADKIRAANPSAFCQQAAERFDAKHDEYLDKMNAELLAKPSQKPIDDKTRATVEKQIETAKAMRTGSNRPSR